MTRSLMDRSLTPAERDHQIRTRLRARAAAGAPKVPDGRPKSFFNEKPAMRSAARKRRAARRKLVPQPPSAAVIALTRMGFGPSAGDVEAFNALGANDSERLTAYVDQQLAPDTLDDSAAEARIAQSNFTTLEKSLEQLWQDHVVADVEWEITMQPFWETQLVTFLRAIHSKKQLLEVLADFWHNHFSVFADDFPLGPVWPHSDRDAIRAHALGNFRQMVEAVAKTPAMLYYLNNAVNSFEDANENYARELMELHTLGADAYLGSLPQDEVPVDGEGRPIGYVEEDVVAAARCLTGWTVSDRDWDPDIGNSGTFLYYDPWHDHDPKTILGSDLPASQGPMQDGQDLFDLLVQHPATARFIASKLCRRLIGDFPPQSVVDAAAAVFAAQVDAPDQLAQVVRTILLSPEFLSTWGDKTKRPFEIVVSAFRGAGGDLPFALQDDATNYFLYAYYHTGQPLFSWHPPNGYPDIKAAWNSTSPRVMGWRMANTLLMLRDDVDQPYFDVVGQTPAGMRSAQELVAFWTQRILGQPAAATDHEHLVDFMAQGHNPTFDLPLDSDTDTQDRLRALVSLIFMSPSFLWR
ncbi:MAG: DUF1800 domain-containing protein [Acidobacteriota bacterium]